MFTLGIDVGTSSIKVTLVNTESGKVFASAQYPDEERAIIAHQPGWAEQDPEQWWLDVQAAILRLKATHPGALQLVQAIGIAYQMHGLVAVDKAGNPLRHSIIWCDSRAIPYGTAAAEALGPNYCRTHLLNSPGNFTAAKLAWVKANEPDLYARIDKIMLPGDFIALRLTGQATTTAAALSEGIFWDFVQGRVSQPLMEHFGFASSLIPEQRPVFAKHGVLQNNIASALGLPPGIPVSYKAGDQPNNALSLNVLEPGEVAATAGTSGVIYAVTNENKADAQSRVNSFVHVNHSPMEPRVGVLLCINGTGIAYSWWRQMGGRGMNYYELNKDAATVEPGCQGLYCLPFGNGAERMLGNQMPGATFHGLQFNVHSQRHITRAVQEGIAFSFRYGLDMLRENNIHPSVIRAGYANLFLSPLFAQVFANVTGVPVELHEGDGSKGAAIGAGMGAGIYKDAREAFAQQAPVQTIYPEANSPYEGLYQGWKALLQQLIS